MNKSTMTQRAMMPDWSKQEDQTLAPFVPTGRFRREILKDPGIKRLLQKRSAGSIRQRLYKLQSRAGIKASNGAKPHKGARKSRRAAAAAATGAPAPAPIVNFCPHCGGHLRAIQAAMNL